jgi:hypothetical protein
MTGPFVIALAATLTSGWWQVRTLVQGTTRSAVALRCLDPGGNIDAILPRAITTGCGRIADPRRGAAACDNGGSLNVGGTVAIDRFDLVARRSGPVGAHPAASAVLHVEGMRIADRCPPRSTTSQGPLK